MQGAIISLGNKLGSIKSESIGKLLLLEGMSAVARFREAANSSSARGAVLLSYKQTAKRA